MAGELDIDKLLAACQEAVSNPVAASKTSTEALLVNANPLAAIPKTPPDEPTSTPTPPWRATQGTTTAAKGPRNPTTVHEPRLAKNRPRSSAAKAGTVFPAVPPAARPVAPMKAKWVAARVVAPRVVAPPPAKANAPAEANAPVEAVDSCAAPAKAAAPAPVETPALSAAPAKANAPAAAPAKTAAQGVACPFKALGIPRPPPAAVRPVAALAAHVVPVSEPELAVPKKKHGPRAVSENSQWHTAWHKAKSQGPKALCEFYRAWPKPASKKQKTQRDG